MRELRKLPKMELSASELDKVTGGAAVSESRLVVRCGDCAYTEYFTDYDAASAAAAAHWNANNQNHNVSIGYDV